LGASPVRLLQAFPFQFVRPEAVALFEAGAQLRFRTGAGDFYGAPDGPPPWLLLEVAGQTAEVCIRHRLGEEARGAQLRLAALDQVTCQPPAPREEWLVQVRLESGAGRLVRSAFTVDGDGVRVMAGRLTHYLAEPGGSERCRGPR
jgi:hypothetical protein